MPQRYKDQVEAITKALLESHERDGLIYSAIATFAMVALTIYWVDGLMRLGMIGG